MESLGFSEEKKKEYGVYSSQPDFMTYSVEFLQKLFNSQYSYAENYFDTIG